MIYNYITFIMKTFKRLVIVHISRLLKVLYILLLLMLLATENC